VSEASVPGTLPRLVIRFNDLRITHYEQSGHWMRGLQALEWFSHLFGLIIEYPALNVNLIARVAGAFQFEGKSA